MTVCGLIRRVLILIFGCTFVALASDPPIHAPIAPTSQNAGALRIPRIDRAPLLEEFLEMKPSAAWEGKLARVEGFIQSHPDDGQPATQSTEAYLGYDSQALHVIFIAHDSEPALIRARLNKRESIASDDDRVGIYIDTFHDRRRGYQFYCNALGMQADSIYSEDSDSDDSYFDTVWTSHGRITSGGYVVEMSIPFKSLRFAHDVAQTWNVALWRHIGRRFEGSWWPRVSSRYRGYLTQAAPATGIENISPGRNLQFNPYVSWRAFHNVDNRDPANPAYMNRSAEMLAGLDMKAVLKDSLVLDLTMKPDFSQVESDQPQIATNQRYELFYPETRPFFTENSSFFEVPMVVPNQHLLFTRRIAQPDFGARLTGRLGSYSIGALVADDRAPGNLVPLSDPTAGKHAYFEVLRISREFPFHANVGGTYAERKFAGSYNRVMDLDTTFNLGRTWKGTVMGAYNWNQPLSGVVLSGSTVDATLNRTSRGFNYIGYFLSRSPGFQPAMSYYDHTDWREVGQTFAYQFWPNHSWITRIWAEVYAARSWHYDGVKNWEGIKPMVKVDIKHNTTLTGYVWRWRDTLGPEDFSQLKEVVKYPLVHAYGVAVQSSQPRFLTFKLTGEWGARPNFTPIAGQPPAQARYQTGEAGLTFLTSRGLTITNTYLFDRTADIVTGLAMYNSHIARSKWNWQLNRQLSFRFIAQYNAVLSNPAFTSTAAARGFNADFLISYLVHPGTAIYAGYNSNLSRPGPQVGPESSDRFVNDGRQFFVKASYLFRF